MRQNLSQSYELPIILLNSCITFSMDGLWLGDSWVQCRAICPRLDASDTENFPSRFGSMKSSTLDNSTAGRVNGVILHFPLRIWNTIIPNAYMSLFSVNRPVVVYSGARYPMAALALSIEKTISSARSLCRPESESKGLYRL